MSLSVEDLEELPAGSVVLCNNVEAFIAFDPDYRYTKRLWGTTQSAGSFSSQWVSEHSAELLWKREVAS